MLRSPWCGAMLVAALVVCAASARAATHVASPAPSPAAPAGALFVTTLPSGAEVYVDGAYVGRSPVLVDALGPGRHGVTMTKAGWTLHEHEVLVSAGSVAFEDDRLEAASASADAGTIFVRGVPDHTPLVLDGAPLATNQVSAAAGLHRLTIGMGDVRTTRAVTVFPNMTTEVLARDAASVTQDHESAAVVAALDEWLPDASLTITGKKILLHYEGHVLDGRLGDGTMRVDGEVVSYRGSPEMIAGKLYLPLAVLERLSGSVERSPAKK